MDEDFAIDKVIKNLVNNFLNVSNYDFNDELFNLFESILTNNKLNINSKRILKELSIKAHNSGLLKFKKFIKLKIE